MTSVKDDTLREVDHAVGQALEMLSARFDRGTIAVADVVALTAHLLTHERWQDARDVGKAIDNLAGNLDSVGGELQGRLGQIADAAGS